MSEPFIVSPTHAPTFTATAEIALLRQVLARRSDRDDVRLKLANCLNQGDAFDDTIALFDPQRDNALSPAAAIALGKALFARGTPDDIRRVGDVAAAGEASATTPGGRARAMADQAKVLLYSGKQPEALARLGEALTLDRHNVAAFKRLALELLRLGRSEEALELTERLEREGVGHSRLFAARAMALAALGRIAEARALTDIPAFLSCTEIAVPPEWVGLEEFNAALEREIMANPGLRYERFGTASAKTWRVDAPANAASPAVRALMDVIAAQVERYAEAHGAQGHPWLAARPARAQLDSWCVVTEGEGSEVWHMHPFGWMTGGYYLTVPDAVENGTDEAGCLALGLPDGIIGAPAAAAFGEHRVRPRPGLLTLFPSHAYHRTFPHRTGQRRICLAFDVVPAA